MSPFRVDNLPMKTIIAGGRNHIGSEADEAFLLSVGISHVVSGGCRGADAMGEKWAIRHGIPVTRVQADWGIYGRSAGPKRNKTMAEIADAVVLFPGGKGTLDMERQARAMGIKIINP